MTIDSLTYKIVVVSIIVSIIAWFTHVIVCIKAGNFVFLIAGAVFFPIAIVNGIGLWFGLF